MKRELTHEEAFVVLDAVALDTLEASERDAVLAHAEQCAICQAELSQLRDTAAYIAFTTVSVTETTGSRSKIHSRLMARAAADQPVETIPSVAARGHPISIRTWRRAGVFAIAAGVLVVVSLAGFISSMRDRAKLRTQLMSRDSVIAGLTGKDVAMMTLASAESKAPMGHMFWDRAKNMWTLVAHDMPQAKPGRTYQLWLVTANQKISAGTFESKNGEVMMRAMYPLPADQLVAVAVTDEPMGGMPQPTGPMVMVASAH